MRALLLALLPAAMLSLQAQTCLWQIVPAGPGAGGDGVFLVGRSDPARDWPALHPGPGENEAAARPHTFRILFGLDAAPAGGEARLDIEAADHPDWQGCRLRVLVNGQPAGGGTLAPGRDRAAGAALVLRFPAGVLAAGRNQVEITNIDGSGFRYRRVALTVPDGLRTADLAPCVLPLEARPVRALVERGGAGFQPVRLRVVRVGPETSLPVTLDGVPWAPVTLRPGLNEPEILVPAVTAARTAVLAMAERSFPLGLQPVPRLTIYVVPHSHTDIGFTHRQDEVERRQIANLDQGMAAAARTRDYPVGARFVWNVEVFWAADRFLQTQPPERRAALEQAVRDGQVAINAFYANTLTGLSRPEELIQTFKPAAELGARLGRPVDCAMISDVPGHVWGLVPALAQAGVRYLSTSPNYFDRIGSTQVASADQPFWWQGPSGQERVLTWNSFMGYALSHLWGARLDADRVAEYLDHLQGIAYPWEVAYIRWSGLGDNAAPEAGVCDFVRDWNAAYTWPRLLISDARAPFAELERRHGGQLPVLSGDWTPYWEDGAGSSARETGMNRASADRLSQAGALWAMRDPSAWPAAEVADAWRAVLLFSEHTWGAYNSVTEPAKDFVRDQWEVKKGYAEAADRRTRALLARAWPGAPAAGRFDVANTLSWTRTAVVRVAAELSRAGDRVLGPDGRPVPSQRLASGELAVLVEDLPPFSARRFRVLAGRPALPPQPATVAGLVLGNGLLRAALDPATGTVTELGAAGAGNLVAAGTGLNTYLHMVGADPARAVPAGPARITVLEPGPLVAALRAEATAPGVRSLVQTLSLEAGTRHLGLVTAADKLRPPVDGHGGYMAETSKESVSLAFPFALAGAQARLDLALARPIRPDLDQIAGSCRNWFSIGNWADLSNAGSGVTLVSLDTPLLQVGGLTANLLNSQGDPAAWRSRALDAPALYPWLMNNHWGTNYRAYQEGPVSFRFAAAPHAGFDGVAAARLAAGLAQPLLALAAAGPDPGGRPLLRVSPGNIAVVVCKPADDGKGWILRLHNLTGEDTLAVLDWGPGRVRTLWSSGTLEARGERLGGTVAVPGWAIRTVRAE